jgi:hypothetical protein
MARMMRCARILTESAMRTDTIHPAADYRLCFQFLHEPEVAYDFPCDAHGHVDLDTLSRCSFNDYLYARALIGMQFRAPSVCGARELSTPVRRLRQSVRDAHEALA